MLNSGFGLRRGRRILLGTSAVVLVVAGEPGVLLAQTQLPVVTVQQPKPKPPKRSAGAKPNTSSAAAPSTANAAPTDPGVVQATKFDNARNNIFAPIGSSSYAITKKNIETLPQGTDAAIDKILLQAPGVSQDSAASGALHVRNEHANVAYRINGIMLPDNVVGLGQIIDPKFIGSMSLLTGALPAQFGLRTAGVVDITTPTSFENGGDVGIYGGSRETLTPSFDYGGHIKGNCTPSQNASANGGQSCPGDTQYFVSGRGFFSSLGIENPTSTLNANHDRTQQGSGFGYVSTIIDDTTRLSFIGGVSNKNYQIPNNPGQPAQFTADGFSDFNSLNVNERQTEQTRFGVLALQKTLGDLDLQLSYFTQYSAVHFTPDNVGDLMFNGVATDVNRQNLTNGIQGDGSLRINDAHTLRAGFTVQAEQTSVANSSLVLPFDNTTDPPTQLSNQPLSIRDVSQKLGWLTGIYIQDEWRLNDKLTINAGLRFDQMDEYISANQFSPRFSVTYKPFDGTTIHAGYARTFTPPNQVIAAPVNTALFTGTAQQPGVPGPYGQVLPERADVVDVGVVQKVLPGLEVGVDAYYKHARDLLDDGQFGAALVLSGFNYDKGENTGIEFKASYVAGNFRAYGNLAVAKQIATNVVSNQFLFDPDELAYINSHYVFTDHAQTITASAGASYLWNGTTFSADLIVGSGLRAGFANTGTVAPYAQVNFGVSHEYDLHELGKFTARFDIVNALDAVYEIRDGSGIGVFASQFGPRRGYYFGLSKKI